LTNQHRDLYIPDLSERYMISWRVCSQVHKLFRGQAQSPRSDTGPVGGQAPGAHVGHGPVERAEADGPH